MSTRHRTVSASRQDAYGLWRPSDSDSDRPRQTMATTQRHNVEQAATVESARKHRSSRRTDPLDPAAHSHHKPSRDKSSTIPQSYYAVPQSPLPSTTSRTYDVYSDAYGLRAYLKKKTDKRSPRSSNEKVPAPDDTQAARSVYPSRYDYATAAAYAPPPASTSYYTTLPEQTTRDPTSSSRHHRDRERDREKSSRRDVEKASMRDYASERSEDRERRRRKEKEAGKEKERSSKGRDKHTERDRSKHRGAHSERTVPDANSSSLNHAHAQAPAPAQRSTDKLPAGNTDQGRLQQAQAVPAAAVTTPTALPWSGLTAGGRPAVIHASNPVVDAGYPSASDREDPPLPIPPPGHRRETSSSKARGSQRHRVLAQQAAQDSGISSSEQEHSVRTRVTDRRIQSREQASTLGRGQSSGPSGSENEKAPAFHKERRKHKESSRHRSKTAATDGEPPGPTTSQEIATAWYQRHVRETSGAKQTAPIVDSPQRAPTVVPTSNLPTQPSVPYTGKPTSHGPSEPHAGTLPPKNHSAASGGRQMDVQVVDRAYDTVSRSQPPAQYYQQSAGRSQDTTPQTVVAQAYTSAHVDGPRVYQHSSVNTGANGSYQQPGQGYLNPVSQSRHAEPNEVPSSAAHGSQQTALPEVVVRPPSAAPTQQDPYTSRMTHHTSRERDRRQRPQTSPTPRTRAFRLPSRRHTRILPRSILNLIPTAPPPLMQTALSNTASRTPSATLVP
ncbi:hypothetical protein BC628DRAFT_761737 [Trametes gibbosa]|nr:hypothetical protein BC628DRAFT_761737 [Trametes gibbosa]